MGPESYALGFGAGVLSILSPCVLPLLPIVFASAAGKHRYGPLALAVGLTLSFVASGLFLATIGYSLGIEAEWIRKAAGVVLAGIGLVLIVPALSARFSAAAGPLSAWAESRFGTAGDGTRLRGQFGMGVVLGVIWVPCVGPTLGAASLLASQGENLGQVTLVMAAFGLGAGLPLATAGTASREILLKWRGRMARAGAVGRATLGGLLLVIGVMILAGLDKRLETWLVEVSPDWLITLTTSL